MKSSTRQELPSLKTCDKRIVHTETSKVNIAASNITACNILLYAVALVVSERLGKIRKGKGKTKSEKKELYWKRRIENNLNKWRHDLSKMTEVRYCRTKLGELEREMLDRSYGLSDKRTFHVINFLKQRITTAGAKICRYNQLDDKMNGQTETPDPKGSTEF